MGGTQNTLELHKGLELGAEGSWTNNKFRLNRRRCQQEGGGKKPQAQWASKTNVIPRPSRRFVVGNRLSGEKPQMGPSIPNKGKTTQWVQSPLLGKKEVASPRRMTRREEKTKIIGLCVGKGSNVGGGGGLQAFLQGEGEAQWTDPSNRTRGGDTAGFQAEGRDKG